MALISNVLRSLKWATLNLLLTSLSAVAQWKPAEIDLVRSFNAGVVERPGERWGLNGPYMASVLDTAWLKAKGSKIASAEYSRKIVALNLPDQPFTSPDGTPVPLKAIFFSARGVARAPLVLYLPGIFQDENDGSSTQAIRELLSAGNSVLFIANPLTEAYMRNFPRSPPANFVAEATVALNGLGVFVAEHRAEVSSVHVAGASYGSFLAAIVAALDAERPRPVIDGQTTMIFPPFDMEISRERLDRMVDQYQEGRWSAAALIAKKFQEALIGLLTRMREEYLADSRHGFVARRYRAGAANFLVNLNLAGAVDTAGIRFWTVIHQAIEKTSSFYVSERSSIGYWLEKAAAGGNRRLRVLTLDDDWLNNPRQWTSLPTWMQNDRHLLVRKVGGHAGIVSSTWLESFVLESMRVAD